MEDCGSSAILQYAKEALAIMGRLLRAADKKTGSDLDCSTAPASEQTALHYAGGHSRRLSPPASVPLRLFFLSTSQPLRGVAMLVLSFYILNITVPVLYPTFYPAVCLYGKIFVEKQEKALARLLVLC